MSESRILGGTARGFQPQISDHRPALDGIRGLAILLVMAYDCLKLPASGPVAFVARKISSSGWLGVDLFFVLSGCLITGILLDTKGKTGYLRSFFIRRSLRIFPLYYFALVVAFFVVPALAMFFPAMQPVSSRVMELSEHQWWFWTYLQNWYFTFHRDWPAIHYLNHFWSLAIEEQFYLVWPFVVALFARKSLAQFCMALVVIAFVLRVMLLNDGAPSVALYVMTVTRMDSLCLGALVAIGLRNAQVYKWMLRWCWLPIVGLGLCVVGIDVFWPVLKSGSAGAQTIGHSLMGGLFAATIFTAAVASPKHWLARILSLKWLTIWGKYSYAIYIMHRVIYRLVLKIDLPEMSSTLSAITVFATTLALSLVAAAVSWKFFEQPILSLKSRFPRPDETTSYREVLPPTCEHESVASK